MNDLTSLPEKWCIKPTTKEEAVIIGKWFDKNHATSPRYERNACCDMWHTNAHQKDNVWFADNKHGTEITFDQFKKWVLKEEEEFKVGDWVVRTEDGNNANRVTKGKCYQLENVTKNHVRVTDDRGISDAFQKAYFRKALPHEVPAIDKESSRDFQVGKWYYFESYSERYTNIAKLDSMSSDTFLSKNWIMLQNKRTSGTGSSWHIRDIDNLREVTPEEIQQYLPDGHPDKITKPIIFGTGGEINDLAGVLPVWSNGTIHASPEWIDMPSRIIYSEPVQPSSKIHVHIQEDFKITVKKPKSIKI